MIGNGSQVKHSKFIYAQGDAITDQGANTVIEFNEFTELNGSALHLSDSDKTIVRYNHIWQTNLLAERVSHAEAAITWSLANKDVLVENNCIKDIPVAAMGLIAVHGNNRGATIRNNQICRTHSLLKVLTVESLPVNLTFSNNEVERGGLMTLLGLNDTLLSNIEISDNDFIDTPVYALNNKSLKVSNNSISFTSGTNPAGDPNTALETTVPDVDSVTGITVLGGSGITITSNKISAGRTGIKIKNSNTIINDAIINGNELIDQFDSGFVVGPRRYFNNQNQLNFDHRGVSATNNTVISNELTSDIAAVDLGPGASFTDSCIESSGVGILIRGYSNNPPEPYGFLNNNHIRSEGLSITGSSPFTQGIVLSNNVTSNGIDSSLILNSSDLDTPASCQ